MTEQTYPYATHLDIKFPPLALIDVTALAGQVTDAWYNQTLCKVNDSVVRLGVMQGEYHWHKHEHDDEFFFCLDGLFVVDLEDRSGSHVLAIDEALSKLSAIDPQKGRVVELRFFGGLSVEETAAVLDVSPRTVKRDWSFAKAWLFREIGKE